MFTKPVTALLGLLALCLTMALASKSAEQLQIGVKYKPDECPLKTRNGDRLSMQYVTILT
jgi:FK506-binding protein 2